VTAGAVVGEHLLAAAGGGLGATAAPAAAVVAAPTAGDQRDENRGQGQTDLHG
jgi:hypothetical protein